MPGLAYRQSWRDAQRPADDHTAVLDPETRAAEVRRDGYAANARNNVTTLGVPVPMDPVPLAALVLPFPSRALGNNGHTALLTVLCDAAQHLSEALPSMRASTV